MADFSYTPVQKRALQLLGGPARHVMLFGGSRSGKTFVICAALAVRALRYPGCRQAVIRRYYGNAVSSIGGDTLPKVLALRFPELKVEYRKSSGVFIFPNGSEIQLIGLDDPRRSDKILGNEFFTIYFNESSELDYLSVQTALTRLAQKMPGGINRAYYDCNPPGKRHWTYRVFVEKRNPADNLVLAQSQDFSAMQLNPVDNQCNLPEGYISSTLMSLPRQQRERFLEGRFSDAVENALWTPENLALNRRDTPPELVRIVIGVDPAVTGSRTSDLTGIVGCGLGLDKRYYVLADASCRGTPVRWMQQLIGLYRQLEADLVVGECNNGGDLISSLLEQLAPELPFRQVRATRGKLIRAEPVAMLYEKNLVSHIGELRELEDELTSYNGNANAKSPDRMDALVWSITELMAPASRCVLA